MLSKTQPLTTSLNSPLGTPTGEFVTVCVKHFEHNQLPYCTKLITICTTIYFYCLTAEPIDKDPISTLVLTNTLLLPAPATASATPLAKKPILIQQYQMMMGLGQIEVCHLCISK